METILAAIRDYKDVLTAVTLTCTFLGWRTETLNVGAAYGVPAWGVYAVVIGALCLLIFYHRARKATSTAAAAPPVTAPAGKYDFRGATIDLGGRDAGGGGAIGDGAVGGNGGTKSDRGGR